MTVNDIKGILWLLKKIEENEVVRPYFQHELNLHYTDLARLIKQYEDINLIIDNPMKDEFNIAIMPQMEITK